MGIHSSPSLQTRLDATPQNVARFVAMVSCSRCLSTALRRDPKDLGNAILHVLGRKVVHAGDIHCRGSDSVVYAAKELPGRDLAERFGDREHGRKPRVGLARLDGAQVVRCEVTSVSELFER